MITKRTVSNFLQAFLQATLLLFLFFRPAEGLAAETPKSIPNSSINFIADAHGPDEPQLVRVGFADLDDFFMEDENGLKSGYAYEYLQQIAYHTGWKLEYIYATREELWQMLVDGKIDILPEIPLNDYTSARSLFTDEPMGDKNYFLSVLPSRTDITEEDLSTFNGRTIAVSESSMGNSFLSNWLAGKNLECTIVNYPTMAEAEKAFQDGLTDLISTSDIHGNQGWIPLVKTSSYSYYLVVNARRPDLRDQLDIAQRKLYKSDPYYNYSLYAKYFSAFFRDSRLTKTEQEWLSSNPTIIIGCMDNNMPYCSRDVNGNPTGLIKDLMNEIVDTMNLTENTFQFRFYNEFTQLIQDLSAGVIHAAFPLSISLDYAEKSGLYSSKAVATETFSTAYSTLTPEFPLISSAETVDTPEFYYTAGYYPEVLILPMESRTSCLDAVVSGEIPYTIMSSIILENYIQHNQKYHALNIMQLAKSSDLIIGVKKENIPFIDIVNKVLDSIPDENIANIINRYVSQMNATTLMDFIQKNFWYIFFCIILALFLYAALLHSNSEKKRSQELDEKLEHELRLRRNQESLFNELVEEYDAIFMMNMATQEIIEQSCRGRIKELTDAWGKPVLINLEEFVSSYTKAVVYSEDVPAFRNALSKELITTRLETGKPYLVNFRISHKKELYYYQLKIVKDFASPESNMIIMGVRNIDTETKLSLEQNRQLQEAMIRAESANKAKSAFLFNMSHDIRTPMNAIIGFTDMALSSSDNPAKVRDYLGKVRLSSDHLLKLINDILDMSRIENNRIELNYKEVNLYTVTKNLITIVQGTAEENKLNLELSIENLVNADVYTDILRLNQIMMNIISNALKYTRPGGTVTYTVRQTGTERNGQGLFQFVVKDNGIGMSAEFQKIIFDSFTREKSSTISGVEGTGLGMSITKKLVDKMDGDIQIESATGKGTTVTVTLPLKLKLTEQAPEESTASAETGSVEDSGHDGKSPETIDSRSIRILLAEDNELNREIARTILEEAGFNVDTAEDGVVAVETYKNAPAGFYDLILMDIQMPFMNGYAATRVIRNLEDKKKASVPIIAMTANAFDEDKKKAEEAGMNGHLTKPIDVPEMMKVIQQYAG